jgi:tetratricopeptide (TPR) repeat protein
VRRPRVAIEQLYRLIPDVSELEELRLSLAGVAVPDPDREWDGPTLSTTLDKRVVTLEQMEKVLGDTEATLHRYVTTLFERLRPVFASYYTGDDIRVAEHLVQLGAWFEEIGRYEKARLCFGSALEVTLPFPEKTTQIIALRRAARVARALGDLDDALLYYRRSGELADAGQDAMGYVISMTGQGNVLADQGRWSESEQCYLRALARADHAKSEELRLQRAQLFNNLGMVAMRQGRLEEAERWLLDVREQWAELASPVDLAVCCHNLGMLRSRQGRPAEARDILQYAMELPINRALRVIIALELAETHLRLGQYGPAERWGREAEQQAIRSRSPYYLADMYRGLGKIVWATGDENAVTFFEKALEIARKKGYLMVEAETLFEYARLRSDTGQAEEAEAYLERAREIFGELHAGHESRRVDLALGELRRIAPRPI